MKSKKIDGCGKQCLVDGELYLQCGDIHNGVIFLCHKCVKKSKMKGGKDDRKR